MQFLDENDNLLQTDGASNNRIPLVMKIPVNTKKIKLFYTGGTSDNITVYDMFIFDIN